MRRMRRVRGMGVVFRDHHETPILLRENELRGDLACGRAARFGDRRRARRGRSGGSGHGIRSDGNYGGSTEHGEFSCNTAEQRLSVEWHACIPFPL